MRLTALARETSLNSYPPPRGVGYEYDFIHKLACDCSPDVCEKYLFSVPYVNVSSLINQEIDMNRFKVTDMCCDQFVRAVDKALTLVPDVEYVMEVCRQKQPAVVKENAVIGSAIAACKGPGNMAESFL